MSIAWIDVRIKLIFIIFFQTLSLLLSILVDIFGNTVQPPAPVEASEIADLIDFL